MRRYEQVCILRPSLSEEEITRITDNTTQLIQEDDGSVIFLNKWGMRKLAYPIKKESQGYYVLCDFAASSAVVAEIERKFRIDDAVLKYLTVKISDAISAEEIETARSEAEARAIVPEPEEETVAPAEEKPEESKSASEPPSKAEMVETPAVEEKNEAPAEPDGDGKETEEPAQ
ncbi:MAG: 30S ribosomal protein S6 [Desulfofustis sp.]|nr:30S ribosomal protein S6 [Desulfofustis sp.]